MHKLFLPSFFISFLFSVFNSTTTSALQNQTGEHNGLLVQLPDEINAIIFSLIGKPPALNKTIGNIRQTCKAQYELIHTVLEYESIFEYALNNYQFDFSVIETFVKELKTTNESILSVPLDSLYMLERTFSLTRSCRNKTDAHFTKKWFITTLISCDLLCNIEQQENIFPRLNQICDTLGISERYKYLILKKTAHYLLKSDLYNPQSELYATFLAVWNDSSAIKVIKEKYGDQYSSNPTANDALFLARATFHDKDGSLTRFNAALLESYDKERAEKIQDYLTHSFDRVSKLENKKGYGEYEGDQKRADEKMKGKLKKKLICILSQIMGFNKKSYFSGTAPQIFLPSLPSDYGIIRRPSKTIKLYETLCALDKNYAVEWFKAWFREWTCKTDQPNHRKICEIEDLLFNERTPCPLLKYTENNEKTIYDVLKSRQMTWYYGKQKRSVHTTALKYFLSLAPLAIIKQHEQQLHTILDDLVELANHEIYDCWRRLPGDSYKNPLVFLQLFKSADVFFYEDLKSKLVRKIYHDENQMIDLSKNPFKSCIQRRPPQGFDLLISQDRVLLFIDFYDIDLFYSILKNLKEQHVDDSAVLDLIIPWLYRHTPLGDIHTLLEKIKNDNDLKSLYENIMKQEELHLEKILNPTKIHDTDSAVNINEGSFPQFLLQSLRHHRQILYHVKQFFCLAFCAILSSFIGSVLLNKDKPIPSKLLAN